MCLHIFHAQNIDLFECIPDISGQTQYIEEIKHKHISPSIPTFASGKLGW